MVEKIKRIETRVSRPLLSAKLPGGEKYESPSIAQIWAVEAFSQLGELTKSELYGGYKEKSNGRTDNVSFETRLKRRLRSYGYMLICDEYDIYRMTYDPSRADQYLSEVVPCLTREDKICKGCQGAPKWDNPQNNVFENGKLRADLVDKIAESILSVMSSDLRDGGLANINRDPGITLNGLMPVDRCYKTLIFAESRERLGWLFAAFTVMKVNKFVKLNGEDENTFRQRITPTTNREKNIFRSIMELRKRGALNRIDIWKTLIWRFSEKGNEEAPGCAANYMHIDLTGTGEAVPLVTPQYPIL